MKMLWQIPEELFEMWTSKRVSDRVRQSKQKWRDSRVPHLLIIKEFEFTISTTIILLYIPVNLFARFQNGDFPRLTLLRRRYRDICLGYVAMFMVVTLQPIHFSKSFQVFLTNSIPVEMKS